MPHEPRRRWLVGLAAGALIAGLVVALVVRGHPVPDGPVAVAWDQQPCAHCHMLVGEPAHAAQLVTTDGDVAFFDDPGCLFHYLHERAPAVHRLWFHDSTADRWLPPDGVAFATGATTPMGYGLAAVPRGTADLDFAAARDRVLGVGP